MSNFFSEENPAINFMTVVCDIIILHFLWVITSIPIVTIGASTTALYYTSMKCIRFGEGAIARRYFKSFKENLKQSTVLWILMLAAGGICGFDLYFSIMNDLKILTLIFVVMSCAYLFTAFYVFPLQAQFDNEIKITIRNAFILSIRYLPWTLLIILGTGLLLFICYANIIVMGTMAFIGVGLHGYVCSYVYVHIFKNYLPDEVVKDDEDFHIADGLESDDTIDTLNDAVDEDSVDEENGDGDRESDNGVGSETSRKLTSIAAKIAQAAAYNEQEDAANQSDTQ